MYGPMKHGIPRALEKNPINIPVFSLVDSTVLCAWVVLPAATNQLWNRGKDRKFYSYRPNDVYTQEEQSVL